MGTPYDPYNSGQQQPGAPGGGYQQYPQYQQNPQGQYPPQGGYAPGPYQPQGGYPPGTQRGYLQGGSVAFAQAGPEAIRNIFNYNGRASRSAYWWFVVWDIIAVVVLVILGIVLKEVGLVLDFLVYIVLGLTGLSLIVRRLHDQDKSGFFVFLGLIPFVGAIVLLVFALMEGTPGPNRFG